jgi:uncharacterized protein (TIGR03437 family)
VLGPSIESISNAASYAVGTLAPNSYGALFGLRLTPNQSVRLRDSAGTLHTPELIFSNALQINFIVPGNAARGQAAMIVTTATGAAEFPGSSALPVQARAPPPPKL